MIVKISIFEMRIDLGSESRPRKSRSVLLTDDGASLYVHYTGLLQMNQKVADAPS